MTNTETVDLFSIPIDELSVVVNDPTFIKPLNYFFLLALPQIKETTKGGIYLAQGTKDTALSGNNIGRIVGVGGTVGNGKGSAFSDCVDLVTGDYVGYNPHAGLPQPYGDFNLITIADDGLRCKISDISKHNDGIFKTFDINGVNNG